MTAAGFKRARKKLGFSQQEMGEALGRSVRMIKYYEAGVVIPKIVRDRVLDMVTKPPAQS